jgi:hypothetical protein
VPGSKVLDVAGRAVNLDLLSIAGRPESSNSLSRLDSDHPVIFSEYP